MANALHSAQTAADGNHVIQGFPDAANATTRLAISVVASDVGRVVYQSDNKTFWVLTNNVGPAWADITAAGGGGSTFGNDYQHVQVGARTTTTLAIFQTKITLISAAVTGEYLLTWHATIDNPNKQGETRLRNVTDAVTVGATQSSQLGTTDVLQTCGFSQVTFAGVAKTFEIQWRDVTGGNVQGIQDAGILLWRVA